MEKNQFDYIIVTSDEPWSEIWHTQLHYAFQLSKITKVIFLGPPDSWKISNLFRTKQKSFSVNHNLVVVTYHNLIPARIGKIALWFNDQINKWSLKNNVLGSLTGKKGIMWHFDPHRSYYIFRNDPQWLHLFHVIDPIANCNLDIPLAKLANLIVVTSPKFVDHYIALNKNVLQIGQGVDLEFYNQQNNGDSTAASESDDAIVLLGTITDQINFELLKQIAERFPSKLVLIGPDMIQIDKNKIQFKELLATAGVKWLGPMAPADFRHHLRVCRVGIIAYDQSINYKNDYRSPLKVISYLACGKNIISNIDCEIPSLTNQAIYNVTNDEDYFDLIDRCYQGNLHFNKQAVLEYLHTIEYSHLLEIIFTNLGEELPKR